MEDSKASYYWFKADSDVHEELFAYVKHLQNEQGYISTENIRNIRLYSNHEYNSIANFNLNRVDNSMGTQNRVTFNIVQSMIDTAVSKITKNKPRPYFLTDGGNWSLKRKAQKLTQFLDGAFYHTEYYKKASLAFKHACITGTGCLKIFKHENNLCVEHVLIDEITIDQKEAFYGTPRQIHQRKWINRDVLIGMFPKYKSKIEQAATSFEENHKATVNMNSDMVLVVESWKLPSSKKASDGRHAICLNNVTLFDEEWDKDYFPFVFFKWNDRPVGFFGQGISEQLAGIQLEINKILRTIQVSMHLVSVPKIFVEASSKIVTSHLNNKIGGIIKYAGTPPTEGKLGTIPPELFNHLDRLYQRAYAIIGISQLSAQAQKPQGLNSGKALRTYNDLETERFTSVGKNYEDAAMSAAKLMICTIKEIASETDNFQMSAPGSKFLSKIAWSEVEMDESDYIMQCFPVSALSNDPASRMQEVQELMQAGLVDKTIGLKLLDYPDLRAYYDIANASVDEIERQIELMIDKGEYNTPEPYQNLPYALVTCQNAYLMYKAQGAPEENLDLLRRFMDDCNELMTQATQPTPEQAQQMAAGQPLGVPQAPQQSDLLPVSTAQG